MNLIQQLENEQNLRKDLWEKVKKDWPPSNMDELYILDESKKIIAGRIDGITTVIGFFHFEYAQGNELLADDLVENINEFTRELKNMVISNKWFPHKQAIITSYQLSSFQDIQLNRLENKGILFGYLNTYPNFNKNNFRLQIDQLIK